MTKSPYEVVKEAYTLPLTLYPFQVEIVNELAPIDRDGEYAQVGTGKTPMSTIIALYRMIVAGYRHTVVAMPPILLMGWYRWLQRIPEVTSVVYWGTPKERKQINLDRDFILMSMQIFKKDLAYLADYFEHLQVQGIVDEATSIKNVSSDNYKMTRDFYVGRPLQLLTGTPLTTPGDAYAYVKTVAPTIYRNQNHFNAVHVEERNFFKKVTKWCNLDLLAENMLVNSVRVLKREVLGGMEPLYIPMPYTLDAEHQKLYHKLGNEQLLILESGGKIDATTAPKLYQAMQQIVVNPDHFSGIPGMRSTGLDLLDEVLEQLNTGRPGGDKLIVFANYKLTMRLLEKYLAKYNVAMIYGDVSPGKQINNLARFIDDPNCWVLAANPVSAGYGVDGLQHVCSNILFLELPRTPKDVEQSVGRLDRDGQKDRVTVRIATAEGTIQVRLKENLLNADALVNKVQGGFQDLRDAIYGA
jgi:SNF2 family DNA or RNA helicase